MIYEIDMNPHVFERLEFLAKRVDKSPGAYIASIISAYDNRTHQPKQHDQDSLNKIKSIMCSNR